MSEQKEQEGQRGKTWGPNTLNNYTDADIEMFKGWSADVTRLRVSKEIGESGTPHLQFSLTFKQPKRFAAMKKLHSKVHWVLSRDTDGCYIYCGKEGSEVIIDIDNRKSGKRTDVEAAYEAIEQKRTKREFLKDHPSLQAIKVYDAASLYLTEPRAIGPVQVIWMFGPTGSGKTRTLYDKFGPDVYVVEDFKWWDGYCGQKTIALDDFRPNQLGFAELLRLLDIYPLRKQVKGGWVHLQHQTVVITTPDSPIRTYSHLTGTEDIEQLLRRITETYEFDAPAIEDAPVVVPPPDMGGAPPAPPAPSAPGGAEIYRVAGTPGGDDEVDLRDATGGALGPAPPTPTMSWYHDEEDFNDYENERDTDQEEWH